MIILLYLVDQENNVERGKWNEKKKLKKNIRNKFIKVKALILSTQNFI
jgi:hypothetical protein